MSPAVTTGVLRAELMRTSANTSLLQVKENEAASWRRSLTVLCVFEGLLSVLSQPSPVEMKVLNN